MAPPVQISSVSDIPAVKPASDWASAYSQVSNLRSSYLQYIQSPSSDPSTDTAIRNQFISAIQNADDQAIKVANSSTDPNQAKAYFSALQSNAEQLLNGLAAASVPSGGKTFDTIGVSAGATELTKINTAATQYAPSSTPATAPVSTPTPATTPASTSTISAASLVPTAKQQNSASVSLGQSQNLRDQYIAYLKNPNSDPATDKAIRQAFINNISSADTNTANLINNLSDNNTSVSALKQLSDQANNAALSICSLSPSSSDCAVAKQTANDASNAYANTFQKINNFQPQDNAAIRQLLNNNPIFNPETPLSTTNNIIANNLSTLSSKALTNITTNNLSNDGRIRLTPKDKTFMGNGSILAPINGTNGLLFPYTPNVTWSVSPQYSTQQTTHANQDYRAFVNVPAMTITIAGPFTAQNNEEALYMLGALHFLRTVTKMHFGTDSNNALGMPPPVLVLNGYGKYIFNNLPVIITAFNMPMPNTVDYMTITTDDGTINQIPVVTEISVTCVVQTTPQFQRAFNWDDFASGKLMTGTTNVTGGYQITGGWF